MPQGDKSSMPALTAKQIGACLNAVPNWSPRAPIICRTGAMAIYGDFLPGDHRELSRSWMPGLEKAMRRVL